jgi:type VI secretion system secreted protein VgrG
MTTLSLPSRPQNLELQVDSGDAFDVREFAVEEGVNTLFSIELLVRCENPAVDFEQTIGARASFTIGLNTSLLADTPSPSWNGIVANIEQVTAEDSGLSTYRVRLAPALWLLTQRTNCRVFQQMTDLQVVLAMFEEWG